MVGSGLGQARGDGGSGEEMRTDGLRVFGKHTMVILVWYQLYGKPSLSSISYVLAIVL